MQSCSFSRNLPVMDELRAPRVLFTGSISVPPLHAGTELPLQLAGKPLLPKSSQRGPSVQVQVRQSHACLSGAESMRLPQASPSCGVSMGILPRVTEPGAPKAEARAVSQQGEQGLGWRRFSGQPALQGHLKERHLPGRPGPRCSCPCAQRAAPGTGGWFCRTAGLWEAQQGSGWSKAGGGEGRAGGCIMRPSWEDSYEENTRIFMSSPSVLSQAALCLIGMTGCLKTRMPERKANLFMPQT